jgi:hypothetical protein
VLSSSSCRRAPAALLRGLEYKKSHRVRGMDRKTRMPWCEPVALALRVAVSRTRMGAQRGDTVADAVEALQDTLEVVVGHILRRQAEMVGDLRPQCPQHLLARQGMALGFEIRFAHAL